MPRSLTIALAFYRRPYSKSTPYPYLYPNICPNPNAHCYTCVTLALHLRYTFIIFLVTSFSRYPDKMPQCQKRTKCHNVDGKIRIQQRCYKDVTEVGASAETHLLKFSLLYEILTGFYSKLAQNKPSKVYKSLKITKKIKKFCAKKIVYFTKKKL